MDEIKKDQKGVPDARTAADALRTELFELDRAANTLKSIRAGLADKVRNLYTAEQVGDAQTSEAELVTAGLRRRVAELEHNWEIEKDATKVLREKVARMEGPSQETERRLGWAERERDAAQEQASNLKGWLELKEGELISANAQRDHARRDAETLERSLAAREALLADATRRLTEAQESAQRVADRLVKIEQFAYRAAVTEDLNAVVHRPDPGALARSIMDIRGLLQGTSAYQDDDYCQAQLAEIRNVVISDVMDQALKPGNDPADHAITLAEALLEIRELLRASE